jgi:hypothetical protein
LVRGGGAIAVELNGIETSLKPERGKVGVPGKVLGFKIAERPNPGVTRRSTSAVEVKAPEGSDGKDRRRIGVFDKTLGSMRSVSPKVTDDNRSVPCGRKLQLRYALTSSVVVSAGGPIAVETNGVERPKSIDTVTPAVSDKASEFQTAVRPNRLVVGGCMIAAELNPPETLRGEDTGRPAVSDGALGCNIAVRPNALVGGGEMIAVASNALEILETNDT